MTSSSNRLAPVLTLAVAALFCSSPATAGGPAIGPQPATLSILESTDRLIVRLRETEAGVTAASSTSRLEQVAGRIGAKLQRLRGMSGNAHVVQLSRLHSRVEAAALARQLALDPEVQYAEPDLRMVPMRTPNDPFYAQQWSYFEALGGINLPAAWDRTIGSAAVTVAVLDTGLTAHPDLDARRVAGYDFITNTTVSQDGDGRDPNPADMGDHSCNGNTNSSTWHGTHVAGTIGAASDNGSGVAGVNWTSKIQPVRVLGRCGGYTSDIADGIRWAAGIAVAGAPVNATPARVLNMSLGGSGACGTTYQNAINDVVARGAVVVVAAGNSNIDAASVTPASCNGVIAVAASTRTGARANYSNFGPKVALAAPGNSILSTLNTGTSTPGAPGYASSSGTSMATPHVAGVVSLMLSINASMTPAQVLTALQSSARAFPTGTGADCTAALCGAGIVDAAAALAAAVAPTAPPVVGRVNLALPSSGAVMTSSSNYGAGYPAVSANNGDRKGSPWGAGGGWNDGTHYAWGDWLQADFGTARSVTEINVFTVQDNYGNPAEPTEAMTFTQYGITDFEVQYWNGSAWQAVPGGSVTGNNRVWRRFVFTPVVTSKIRVLVLGSRYGWSAVTELEAYGEAGAPAAPAPAAVNHALRTNGAVALGSSTHSAAYPSAAAIDGERSGVNWGKGGGWNDASVNAWPDSLQVSFSGIKTITEIDVYTLQDNFTSPQAPTEAMSFGLYGITDFEVQAWNGAAWVTVPGGSVTGNHHVWRKFTFPAVTTNSIRVVVTRALGGYSRITEIEANGLP